MHRASTPRRLVAATLSIAALAAGTVALAQQPERVLHEYFNPPGDLGELRRAPGDAPGDQAPRITTREAGDAPPLTLDVRDDEQVLSERGPMASLPMDNPQGGLDPTTAANTLDDRTDRVDELNYFSNFDPSVIPYKRVVAQNAVVTSGAGYTFVVAPGQRERVDVARPPQARRGEDVFWGSFAVRAVAGQRVPIPSVAATQRILSVDSEPAAQIVIERDEADNYTMTIGRSGLVRVNLKIAAPRDYFDGEFSSSASWSDFPASRLPEIPARARDRADEVLARIGTSRRDTPRRALDTLIRYFRDFEGRPFPDELRGEDVYASIAREQIGVCRHRSFAFVITAAALGLPSRYVYNEAHAFVEVWWPRMGWRRVDLGGATQDVMMRSGESANRVHDGAANDTLPQPPRYTRELERLAQQEEQRRAAARDSADGADGADGGGDNGGFDVEDGPMNRVDDSDAGRRDDASGDDTRPDDDESGPYEPPDVDDRPGTFAQISRVAPEELKRGESFLIGGRLTDLSGNPVADRPVSVLIVAARSSGEGGRRLGQVRTDMTGRFRAELTLPADLPIGRWSLRVRFDGDDGYQPTTSK